MKDSYQEIRWWLAGILYFKQWNVEGENTRDLKRELVTMVKFGQNCNPKLPELDIEFVGLVH